MKKSHVTLAAVAAVAALLYMYKKNGGKITIAPTGTGTPVAANPAPASVNVPAVVQTASTAWPEIVAGPN